MTDIYIILEKETWEILGVEPEAYTSEAAALNYIRTNYKEYFSKWTDENIISNYIIKVTIDMDN